MTWCFTKIRTYHLPDNNERLRLVLRYNRGFILLLLTIHVNKDASMRDVQKLQQQLADIKEQTMCPVCLDR